MSDIAELKKILADHEKRISVLEKDIDSTPKVKRQKSGKTSIMDLLIELKGDGFFNKPQFRNNIVQKLEESGNIYGGDSLNFPLRQALKSRMLGRKKINGKWGYVKR